MNARLCLFSASVLVAVTGCSGADDFEPDEETLGRTSEAITNAPLSNEMPGVVWYDLFHPTQGDFQTGRGPGCNGIALTRRWIVTAAHCLDDHKNADGTRANNRIRVKQAYSANGGAQQVVTTYARGGASFYLHPDYDSSPHVLSGVKDDFALIKLDGDGLDVVSPLNPPNTPVYFDDYEPWKGDFVAGGPDIVSFGPSAGENTNPDNCKVPYGQNKRTAHYNFTFTRSPGDKPQVIGVEGNSFFPERNLCPGDSGSPWFLQAANQKKYAIAVTTGWYDSWINPFDSKKFTGVLIRPKWDWIIRTAEDRGRPLYCNTVRDHRGGVTVTSKQCSDTPTNPPPVRPPPPQRPPSAVNPGIVVSPVSPPVRPPPPQRPPSLVHSGVFSPVLAPGRPLD